MKYFFVAISLITIMLSLSNCKKSGASTKVSTSLVGTWELRQSQSSMLPTQSYSSGNGNVFKFSDSSYERYTNGNLVKKGSYSVVKDTTVMMEVGLVIPAGKFVNRIIFDSDLTPPKTFMELSNNSLVLISGYFPTDGGSRMSYERQTVN